MGLAPGSEIHRYVVESQIAQGGAAKVYAVRHVTLGTRHALKLLHRSAPGLTEALVREGRMQARLDPTYVVPVTDVLTIDDAPALVMPFVAGCTLSELLGVHRPAEADVAALFLAVARGVASAHAQGIVHRDLKPSNVMLDLYHGRVRVRVTDFGLARWSDGPKVKERRLFQGTPSYSAPEQFVDTAGVDTQADLWSLGVVLYRLLVGRRPFGGGSPKEIYARVRKAKYDDSVLGPGWRELVARLLTVSPEERGPPASEIQAAVEAVASPSPLVVGGNVARIVRILNARRVPYQESAAAVPRTLHDTVAEPRKLFDTMLQGISENTIAESSVADIGPAPRPAYRLPQERDVFIGRDADLERLQTVLRGGSRIVSIVGPGGMGKTRLAVHYGHRYREDWEGGVWFCDLAEARSPDGVASAVAAAIQVPLAKGDAQEQLGHAIAARGRCLIILDNFEQLSPHTESTLLKWHSVSEEAVFLVTTRQVLAVSEERTLPLKVLQPEDATDLFLNRLRSRDPRFQPSLEDQKAIQKLVELLDFLPLAIELAAARARIMSPSKILERMVDRFKLLKSSAGRPKRQATLRAALDWSWELLRDWEQVAIAELSVFEGGFDLEGVEEVLDLSDHDDAPWTVDVVQSLVDKSLVRTLGEGRFDMLKSVGAYASAKLDERGTREAVETRHGRLYARFGTTEAIGALKCHGGVVLWKALTPERENLIVACERAVSRGDCEVAAGTLRAAWQVMLNVGPFAIVETMAERVLRLEGLPIRLRVDVLHIAGLTARRAGKRELAEQRYMEMLEHAEVEGQLDSKCRALTSLGVLYLLYADHMRAQATFEVAVNLARESGNVREESVVLNNLGFLLCELGDAITAEQHCARALSITREVGDRMFEQLVLCNLGTAYRAQGRLKEAWAYYEEAIAIGHEVGTRQQNGVSLARLGGICHDLGRFDEAIEYIERALQVAGEVGSREFEGVHQTELGICHQDAGNKVEARMFLEAALPLVRECRPVHAGVALGALGVMEAEAGRFPEALELLHEGEAVLRAASWRLQLARVVAKRARVCGMQGRYEEGRVALAEARDLEEELGKIDGILRRRIEEARLQLEGSGS